MAIDDLPAPTKSSIDDLPAPPPAPNFWQGVKETVSQGRGATIPFVMGGAGELIKGAGAAGELFTEKAKPITQFGEKVIQESKELYPKNKLATTGGQVASYALPFEAARGGIQAVRGAKATGLLGKTAEATGAGGITGAVTTPGDVGDRSLGGALGASFGLLGEGIPGLFKSGKELIKSLKEPKPFGTSTSYKDIGEKIRSTLGKKVNAEYEARATDAESNYEKALNEARTKQIKQPFSQSLEGQSLINKLEADKTFVDPNTGKTFMKGEDQVKGIDRLINAIKGKTTGGEVVPAGKGKIISRQTKVTPSTTTEKDVTALIEELRYLRDKDATGKPYEAYASLSNQYRQDLIKGLENSLYHWNPKYEAADLAYKNASRQLDKFKTETMARIMRGEKFDFSKPAASDEEFGQAFFKDSKGVQDLKAVAGPEVTKNLAKDYVASNFAGKTPDAMKKFAYDPNNVGWLKEAGILEPVQEYATKAATSADKLSILKRLGFYTAASGVGYKGAKLLQGGTQALTGNE